MGVDYSAYALIGRRLDELEDTEVGRNITENREEDDWQESFEDAYGFRIIEASNYSSHTDYFVGFDARTNDPEEVKRLFTRFKAIFGKDATLSPWLRVW